MVKSLWHKALIVLRNRVLHHLLFWALSFYVLLRFFAYDIPPGPADWIYTFLFHLSLLLTVYVNLGLLIPRLLRPRRFLLYAISAAGLLLATAYFNLFTFRYLADGLFPGYYFISYYRFADILQFVAVYFILSTLLKLSRAWFQVNAQEKRLAHLQREKIDAELKALKNQLDPHFLFNSLNNLYALALDQDERTPEGLLKLSENMRYILYECGGPSVPLGREIDFIRNYVALQEIRMDAGTEVSFSIRGEAEGKRISPLLFLPIVENAFKHGPGGRRKSGRIDLSITVAEEAVNCRVVNDVLPERARAGKRSGIGLANLRRRLELLYPKKHQLGIEETGDQFIVNLKLDLS